jgi:long-chain fatty acid transport protein
MALGSTFTPLADDATAAVTNPAGLVQLLRPEFSFEVRAKRIETPFLKGGRLSGSVTGRGIDSVAGPIYDSTIDSSTFPSYLSFVYPSRRLSVAGYRHQFVNADQIFVRNGVLGLFTTPQGVAQDAREPPQRVTRTVGVSTYGVSAGYRWNDRLSFGAGVTASRFEFHELSTRFATVGLDIPSLDPVHPSVYGDPDFSRIASGGFSSRREVLSPRLDSDDVGFAMNGGVQVRLHRAITLGAAFRQGAQFAFQLIPPDQRAMSGTFKVPNKYTFGAALLPSENVVIVADYSRVQYSSLMNDFVTIVVGPDGQPDHFPISDGNEMHFGLEYVATRLKATPAIRVGAWYDPAHAIRFVPSAQLNPYFNDLFSAALSGGKSLVHYTGGLGLSLNRNVEVNVAGDFAVRNRLVSTSAIFRF